MDDKEKESIERKIAEAQKKVAKLNREIAELDSKRLPLNAQWQEAQIHLQRALRRIEQLQKMQA